MEEIEQQPGAEGQADAGAAEAAAEAGTKKVEGRDPKTVRLKRAYEAEVHAKVASDHSHIIWAYGIIWSIFVIYGVILWRRSVAQSADLEALRRKIGG
ncbi:hypothetical protein G6O69_01595 [Pseudenhygromyxa sp. WMMC2535]|uniref:hypothetical protein n=1 Tax=Pseudenhygromyxa sp. WMMC2535 TaxID=2712867 RepID=UPI001557F350|nr:hypothetical protein [Pseudenhygromyxa sp. WMMC2535]NVB36507.1 hypothetical protein [Pseudenhygromyxa sp. WMMC2535]